MEGIAGSMRRRGVTACLGVAFATLCVLVPSAQAGDPARYASPDGEPTDACTQADPCDLRTAVEGAPTNGVIRLLPGDHDLGQTGLTVDAGKTVIADSQNSFASVSTRGAADPTLTVTGGATVRAIGVTSASLVETFPQPPDPLPPIPPNVTFGGPALAIETSDVVVDRVFARSISPDATCELETGLLRDSVCFNSTSPPPDPNPPPPSTQPEPGPALAMTAADDGAVAATIRNVTSFSREAAGGVFTAGTNATVDLDARNSIFNGQEAGGAASDIETSGAGEVNLDIDFSNYSTLEDAAASGTVPAPGSLDNQTAKPDFAAPLQGNFRQADGSPTIDAGSDSASDLGEFDLANNDRIQGDAIDIGAYEDTAAGPPPDGGAPTVIIRKAPRKKTAKRKATFRFRAADTNGPATFRCKLDKRDLAPCSSPKRYRNLGRGTHKFVVRAKGQDGKVGEPTRYRWKITRKR
ncbi:hypothetical protein HJD18_07305 [Thermoleophilia bacterium SCSIO 60948]|nr:hypothetical protein HJD18_07305 [Thermoleophilia bacterium SCSIO 60948]